MKTQIMNLFRMMEKSLKMEKSGEMGKSLKSLKSLMQIFATYATYASAIFVGKEFCKSTVRYALWSRISLIKPLQNHYKTLTRFRLSLGSNLSRFSLASLICLCMLTVGVGDVWGADYNLVSSVGDLSAGDIVVIATAAGQTATTTESTNSSKNAYWFTYVNSTMNGDATKITSLGSGAAEYTLSKSGSYWIFTCSSGYIGSVSEKKLRYGTGTNTWTISISDNNASIASTDDASLKIYFANGDRFRTYTTAQTAIRLYKKASACANSVTINKGTETNCTFTLSKSGSQASCDGVSTTITVTPNTGYGTPVVTQSGASATPTITGSGTSWTVTYPANTTGTSVINVSCSAKTTTVSFNQNGGSGGQTTSKTATYGQAMPTPITTPTRTGYTFGGYYDGSGGTGNKYYNADGSSAANWNKDAATATLYAKWTAKSFSVTWMVNGEEYTAGGSTSVNYGSHVATLPTAPTPSCGDKFMGWTTTNIGSVGQATDEGLNLFTTAGGAPTISAEGDVTYYAVFADEE